MAGATMMLKTIEQVTAERSWIESALKAKSQNPPASGFSTYRLVLRSVPHPISETIRLRRPLKMLLRSFGFPVTRVEKV
jgi:hypothetical protein